MNAIVPFNQASMAVDPERVARAICAGGLFGQVEPNAVLTLCYLAQAEGQHPAVVFRDYHIIKGKPAKKADAMLRDFIASGGKIEWHRLDDDCAEATFSHAAGGTIKISWDHQRVKKAQLGGNQMFSKFPRQMLRARVISEGVRTIYPAATGGLYVADEVAAFDDEPKPLKQQLQASVDQIEQQEAPAKHERPAKLEGPYTSKTQLWAAVRTFDRELRSCGDIEQLEALLADEHSVALTEECERYFPFLLHGGDEAPPEFEPLLSLISKMRTDLEAQANEGWRENTVTAG